MKSNTVLMIGGPKHGSKLAIAGPGAYLSYYQMPPMTLSAYEEMGDAFHVPIEPVSCPIMRVRLGPREVRRVAHAPGISRDTAESYFWDVVVDAYDRAARVL